MAEFYFKTRLRVGTVFQILKGSSLSTTVAEAFKHRPLFPLRWKILGYLGMEKNWLVCYLFLYW